MKGHGLTAPRTLLPAVTVFAAAAMTCAVATTFCSPRSDRDIVLDSFAEAIPLSCSLSTSLEQFDIFEPKNVFPFNEWLIVNNYGGDHAIDILNPSSGEKIECFRRGRGPGEVLNVGSVQLHGGILYVFDLGRQIYYALDLEASIKSRKQVLKGETRLLDDGSPVSPLNGPFILYKHGNGILATGLFSDGTWFGSLNEAKGIASSIPLIDFKSTRNMSTLENSAFQLSSSFSVSPDGRQGICAMLACGAFSIFDISGNALKERLRTIYYEPKMLPSPGEQITPGSTPDNIRAFYAVQSTDEEIYLLFSGREAGGIDIPSYECSHLLVYDWDGNPIRRYELEHPITSIHLQAGRIYGISTFPTAAYYVYELPQG